MADEPTINREVELCLNTIKDLMTVLTTEQATNRQLCETLTETLRMNQQTMNSALFGRTDHSTPEPSDDSNRHYDPDAPSPMDPVWKQMNGQDPYLATLLREGQSENEQLRETIERFKTYDPQYGFTPEDQIARELATGDQNPLHPRPPTIPNPSVQGQDVSDNMYPQQ